MSQKVVALTALSSSGKLRVHAVDAKAPGSREPKWRNWQTRVVQVHVLAREWRFESSFRHQNLVPERRAGFIPALCCAWMASLNPRRCRGRKPGAVLLVGGYGRSYGCASCQKPQDASLRMTVFGGFKVQADTAVYALFWALLAPHDPNGGCDILLSFGAERLMRHVVERDIRGI